MPELSAICLTHPSRFGNLQRAVTSFAWQSLPASDRELVIATSDSLYFQKIDDWLNACSPGENVSVVCFEDVDLRTLCVEAFKATTGKFIAAWSDDHVSHRERLSFQLALSTQEEATVLSRALFCYYETSEIFIADTLHPGMGAATKCIASSLVCSRDLFLASAILKSTRFSHWPSVLVDSWAKRLPNQPYLHVGSDRLPLYMACATGDNLTGAGSLRARGSYYPGTWDRDKVLRHAAELDSHLSGFGFSRKTIEISGKDLSACTISGDHLFVWPPEFEEVLAPAEIDLRLPGTAELN